MKLNDIKDFLNLHRQDKVEKIYSIYQFQQRYGVKVTDLRTLAKTIGYDQYLASELLTIDSYETIFLSVLIKDPSSWQVDDFKLYAKKARSSSVVDQALADVILTSPGGLSCLKDFFQSDDPDLKYAFYATFQGYLRKTPLDILDTSFGAIVLDHIKIHIQDESASIQNAMNNVVVMAGLHVPDLVEKAYDVAHHIGYVLPVRAKNSCNIQSAVDYLDRYIVNPKYSRVAKLKQEKTT
ncbi:MAG TPA: DNA alkylation repair protein [Acholeplasmataceae bacterium]|nr:DNA alkylation repair protein [Acholeplasmataceae bacterium]HRX44701.1 DNA alkylation repair protein [Acholeplasmataceae bacterium]